MAEKYIGLTELAADVVSMIQNVASGPIVIMPTTGDFPQPGFLDKLYIETQFNKMYIWDGSAYILLSGSGGGESGMGNIFEYDNFAAFPATGEIQSVYIDKSNGNLYRWGGSAYVGIGGITSLATTSAAGLMSSTDKTKLNGLGSNATTSAAGLMSSTDKTKLDGVATSANNYTHPTTDGNKHVPANGTTNSGKVLKAGAAAGTYTWESLAATEISIDGTTVAAKFGTAVSDARSATTLLNVEVRTSDPVSPAVGRIWLRSDL